MTDDGTKSLHVAIARVEERLGAVERDIKRMRQPWPTVVSSLAAVGACVLTLANLTL